MLEIIMMLVMMIFGQTACEVKKKTGKEPKKFVSDTKNDLGTLTNKLGVNIPTDLLQALSFLEKPKSAENLDLNKAQQKSNSVLKLVGGTRPGWSMPAVKPKV